MAHDFIGKKVKGCLLCRLKSLAYVLSIGPVYTEVDIVSSGTVNHNFLIFFCSL